MGKKSKDLQTICNDRNISRDDLANDADFGENMRPITSALGRYVRPSTEVQQKIAEALDLDVDQIDWDPIPVHEISEKFTEIPIVSEEDWGRFNGGEKVVHGGLKAETDTDYIYFKCPECGCRFHPRLCGSRYELRRSSPGPLPYHILAFNFACQECGFVSGFKMFIDQDQ